MYRHWNSPYACMPHFEYWYNNNSYIDELREHGQYVQEFIKNSLQNFKKDLDFNYLHDQDMNYYREMYRYTDSDDRPMLGPYDEDSSQANSNEGSDYDADYDNEVNKMLDEIEEDILGEEESENEDATVKNDNNLDDPKREQYEDYYNEFPEDSDDGPIPSWYQKKLQIKVKESNDRLKNLSNLVCYICPNAADHIKRIEQDHGTTFCKMDKPRHPPFNKPWTNFWKFKCMIKCNQMNKPNHVCTTDCETMVLEHEETGVSTKTPNVSQNEYPNFVMAAVELFQEFVMETNKNIPYLDSKTEKPLWTHIKLRSNYKNELMLIACGKEVGSLLHDLRKYYESGPGMTSNVISVFCINKWKKKKGIIPASKICGEYTLRDKVGPISIKYEPKTSETFNSVEAIQLGRIIQEYASLTNETTLLDIGCNFGVLSLMMSHRCDRVIALNTLHFAPSELVQAEELKRQNKIYNTSFMGCDPNDVFTKCSSLIKRCTTVALLNLASPFGKNVQVVHALRNLPSIWKVIVYGTFTKEFHKNISVLTRKDDQMGEQYLPMQGCILDTALSVEKAFNIVIIFERKSLITPSIDMLAPGPTLNVKPDIDLNYGSLNDKVVQPGINVKKEFGGKPDSHSRKSPPGAQSFANRGRVNEFDKFDRSMRQDKHRKSENPMYKHKARSSSSAERKFHRSQRKSPPAPPAHKEKDSSSTRKTLPDRPWLSIPEEVPQFVSNSDPSPSPSVRENSNDSPALKEESQFEPLLLRSHEESRQPIDNQTLSLRPQSWLQPDTQFDCPASPPPHEQFPSLPPPPPPPSEKFPSPPPPPPSPPEDDSLLNPSQIKKEKDTTCPTATVNETKAACSSENREEGEISPENDEIPTVFIKPEPIDRSPSAGYSEANSENIPLPVTIKSEPRDSHEKSTQPVRIKAEPKDMGISRTPVDIGNMVTPIHTAKALSNSAGSSSFVAPTSFTVDGFQISVEANQSFLSFKRDPDAPPQKTDAAASINAVAETLNESIEEVAIIGEKTSVARPSKRNQESNKPRIRVKTVDEIIKIKTEIEQQDDLSKLIEQRQEIQRQLARDREMRNYKQLHGRSPTPDLPRRYRMPPPFRKYFRSKSPSPRRFRRSPSSSSSSYRLRSPPSPSVSERWLKRERSPRQPRRSPSVRRYRRSPSPGESRSGRRSPSPLRMKRESYSPRRFKREPQSPARKRYLERSRRSRSSSTSPRRFQTNRDLDNEKNSPPRSRHGNYRRKNRSRSRSPLGSRPKRHSTSPLRLSPSPPRKRRSSDDLTKQKKKKKKKKNYESDSQSKSKSKSPPKEVKKESQIKSEDLEWDIPVLSNLSPISDPKVQTSPYKDDQPIIDKRRRASRSSLDEVSTIDGFVTE